MGAVRARWLVAVLAAACATAPARCVPQEHAPPPAVAADASWLGRHWPVLGAPGEVVLLRADGSTQRFGRVQAAIDAAAPGDTVELGAGTYREALVFEGRRGEPGRPITLRGRAGERAVLTGAAAAAARAPNDVWEPAPERGPGVYRSTLALGPQAYRAGGQRLLWPRSAEKLLRGPTRLADFELLAALGLAVIYQEGGTTWLHLDADADPRSEPLYISATNEPLLRIRDSEHIAVANLELWFGGAQLVDLYDAHSCVLEDLVLFGGRSGIRARGGSRDNAIRRCLLRNTLDPRWFWRDVKDSRENEGSAVEVIGVANRVEHCEIAGWFNGINSSRCLGDPCGPQDNAELVVRGNAISDILDDALEFDGYLARAQIHENLVRDAFRGLSFDPRLSSGPGDTSAIFRNRIYATRSVRFERAADDPGGVGETAEPALTKFHPAVRSTDDEPLSEGVKDARFYHNTLVGSHRVVVGSPGGPARDYPVRLAWYNNVFYSAAGPLVSGSGLASDGNVFDGNLYFQAQGSALLRDWNAAPDARNGFAGLDDARGSREGRAAAWESRGQEADPQFVDAGLPEPRVSLRAASPAIDAGVPLPAGFVDSVPARGRAPDQGALEHSDQLALGGVLPASGPLAGGQRIVITGSDFEDGMSAELGGRPLTELLLVSPTTLFGVTPPGPASGPAQLVLRKGARTAVLADAYSYAPDKPAM